MLSIFSCVCWPSVIPFIWLAFYCSENFCNYSIVLLTTILWGSFVYSLFRAGETAAQRHFVGFTMVTQLTNGQLHKLFYGVPGYRIWARILTPILCLFLPAVKAVPPLKFLSISLCINYDSSYLQKGKTYVNICYSHIKGQKFYGIPMKVMLTHFLSGMCYWYPLMDWASE